MGDSPSVVQAEPAHEPERDEEPCPGRQRAVEDTDTEKTDAPDEVTCTIPVQRRVVLSELTTPDGVAVGRMTFLQ